MSDSQSRVRSIPPHTTLSEYYGEPARREAFVRRIFDDTAPWYETIIGGLSLGSGGWYRREALRRAGLAKDMRLLDVATGTGIVARAACSITPRVIGLDPSIGMLLAGRRKQRITEIQSLGERLPFRSASFDMISIGFAMRHLSDLLTSFAEYRRVLKKGSTILILEITPPQSRLGFLSLRLYMDRLVPFFVKLRTRDPEAARLMHYYWETIRTCVPPETILDALREAGFERPTRHVELGIFSEYTAVVPGG